MKYKVNKLITLGFVSLVFLACLAAWHMPVRAVNRFAISIDSLMPELTEQLARQKEAHDWLLNNLLIELDISSQNPVVELQIETVRLPEPFKELKSVRLTCVMFKLQKEQFSCEQGQLELFSTVRGLLDYSADFSIHYLAADQSLKLFINELEVGRGQLDLQFTLFGETPRTAQWRADINARDIDYKNIESFIKPYLKDDLDKLDKVSGRVSFSAQGSAQMNSEAFFLEQFKIRGQLKNAAFSQGDSLGDNLGFEFFLTQQADEQQQHIKLEVRKPTGEIFLDPVYLSFSGQEALSASLSYHSDKNIYAVKNISLSHPQIMHLNLQGLFEFKDSVETQHMDLSLDIKDLSRLNQLYLKNILEGTDYEGLNIEGKFSLEAQQNQEALTVKSKIDAVSIEYKNQLSIENLHGEINWNNIDQKHNHNAVNKNTLNKSAINTSAVKKSLLSWDKAAVSGLPIGKTSWLLETHHDQLSLLQEARIPVFDGALIINSLQMEDLLDDLKLTIDGIIEPVSLELLSSHFNWPVLDGKLGAVIPATHYSQQQLRMGGAMMLQVFDGTIIIKDLIINEPLADTAQLTANIDLNQLDLQSLTRTYDFGEIQGRVEGKVSQLQLDAWRPVAFDAYLRTPDKDKSKHRISQQAIDNLSSLGGASAILSKTFLSVFETFTYKKLGLSCKLANGLCEMDGVEDRGDAYYIVKGGGVPRIDVLGFQRRVDWNTLLERLESIQSANQAVIE